MIPLMYLAAITVAELVTAAVSPHAGVMAHAALLLALSGHAALLADHPQHKLLMCLSLAPLIRILSLALPLAGFPLTYWFLLVSIPLFPATALATRAVGLTGRDIGLTFNVLPAQLLVGFTGIPLGIAEYFILRPAPLVSTPSLETIWVPALVLLIGTGFLEELMFRGLLQKIFGQVMGPLRGLLYVTILFAVLHIGYLSLVDVVFVFGAGALFGWVTLKTGSILGATLSHGVTNITLYLIAPFILPGVTIIPGLGHGA